MASGQLALLQAIGKIKDALAVLSVSVRRVSAVPGEGTNRQDVQQLGDLKTAHLSMTVIGGLAGADSSDFDGDLASFNEAIDMSFDVARTYLSTNSMPDSEVSSSQPPSVPPCRSRTIPSPPAHTESAQGRSLRHAHSTPNLSSAANHFQSFSSVLSELTNILTTNLHELSLLSPHTQSDRNLHLDLSVLQRTYQTALSTLVPLTSTLSSLWTQNFVENSEALKFLRCALFEKEKKLKEAERKCEEVTKMNTVLLEENMRLKIQMGVPRQCKSCGGTGSSAGSRPSASLMSLHLTPFTDPERDLGFSEAVQTPNSVFATPSIADGDEYITALDLDYGTIVDDEGSGALARTSQEMVAIGRLKKDVESSEAVLEEVAKKLIQKPKTNTAPFIMLHPMSPFFAEKDSPFRDVDPATRSAMKLQSVYRGHLARKAFKNIIHRRMIVTEMFTTELSYLRGLLTIHKDFMIPLHSVLLPSDFTTIFRYLDEIASLSRTLLVQLAERVAGWHYETKVGEVFVRAAKSMKVYCHFVNNYDLAMETLSRISQASSVRTILATIVKTLGKGSPELKDLLISPVQRPPRYLLMLKELSKRTPPGHPDASYLAKAVRKMERAVGTINERKEAFEKVKKVCDVLIGSPIDLSHPHRTLHLDTNLLEHTPNIPGVTKLPRRVFLFSDLVVCTREIGGTGVGGSGTTGGLEFEWALPVNDVEVGGEKENEDERTIRLSWKGPTQSGVKP
ncbi:hypothetical protein HK104_010639 [Borealophlyctis nickersoniae]|nr:hypothetical protein HK104_010639 [Borealophlyctis nickersoniae]